MFGKYRATQELQAMLDKYTEELNGCTDKREEGDLIDVVETLGWVINEFIEDSERTVTKSTGSEGNA